MQMYTCKPLCTALELELATRLEYALDQLNGRPVNIDDVLARDMSLGLEP